MKKADLSKGYQNPKRKLGVATHFSEIIELKFGKKLPCILGTLRAPVCKNQTKSKFRGKGGKFDFFHILMLDRLGYN